MVDRLPDSACEGKCVVVEICDSFGVIFFLLDSSLYSSRANKGWYPADRESITRHISSPGVRMSDDVEGGSREAAAGGPMKVFIRVATLASPIPVICDPSATVAVLKETFLNEYRKTREENNSPTDAAPSAAGNPGGHTCRLVCRGRELVDTQSIAVAVRPGDHIHAIVRAAEGAPVAAGRPVVQAIRADARRWVTELRRFLEEQQQQQQPQPQPSAGGDGGSSIGSGTRLVAEDGRTPGGTLSRSGNAAGGSARDQHQRVMQLHGEAASATRRGDDANESTTEFGGEDGLLPVVVERDDASTTTDLGSSTQGSGIVGGYRSLTERPYMTWAGVLCGFFFGFVVIFFIFAAKELRLEFRVGVAAGLVTNVLFAWLLPSPTQVPLR